MLIVLKLRSQTEQCCHVCAWIDADETSKRRCLDTADSWAPRVCQSVGQGAGSDAGSDDQESACEGSATIHGSITSPLQDVPIHPPDRSLRGFIAPVGVGSLLPDDTPTLAQTAKPRECAAGAKSVGSPSTARRMLDRIESGSDSRVTRRGCEEPVRSDHHCGGVVARSLRGGGGGASALREFAIMGTVLRSSCEFGLRLGEMLR